MSSEAITRNDLSAILTEVIPDRMSASDFVMEEYSFNYSTISSGNTLDINETVTKTGGYYPLCIAGFRTGRTALAVDRCQLVNPTSGSTDIIFNARAVASATASTCSVFVLWVKE